MTESSDAQDPPSTEPDAPSRRKTWLGRVILALASTLLSLVAVEAVYRVLTRRHASGAPDDDGGWYERVSRMNRTIYRRSEDPVLVYEPNPGASVSMHYGPAGFNHAGLRDDRETSPAPAEGTSRVLLVGDSIVWGEELALEDSLPRRVRAALERAEPNTRFEVLNGGVTGYDTVQEARYFERSLRTLRPEVVVLVYCLNDAMIMSGPYNRFATPDEAARKEAQDALFERLAPLRAETLDTVAEREESAAWFRSIAHARALLRSRTYARRLDYRDEYLLSHAQPGALERIEGALRAMALHAREAGARTALVLSPMLAEWQAYPWQRLHTSVRAAAERAGWRVFDPLPTWRREGRDPRALRLPGDRLHYGEDGTRAFGAFVAEAVRTVRAPTGHATDLSSR